MSQLVQITVQGKSCQVPAGLNAVQAMWYAGIELVHGIGCLGGVCGACTMTYQSADGPIQTGLACQTQIREGMKFQLYQPEVKRSVPYPKYPGSNPLSGKPDLNLFFNDTLGTTRTCVSCGACSQVCPQEIDAMKGVKESLNGNYETVAQLFLNCVMCGLCASVCESHVYPHLVGLLSRNMVSRYLTPADPQLRSRMEEIRSGKFDDEWKAVLSGRKWEEAGLT